MGVAREGGGLGGGKGWTRGAPWGADCNCEVEVGNGGVVEAELRGGGMKKAGGIRVVRIGLLTFAVSIERGVRDVCGSDVVDGGIGIRTLVEATNVVRFGDVWTIALGCGIIVGVISGVLIRPTFCLQTF
jgi:hypothetical protein